MTTTFYLGGVLDGSLLTTANDTSIVSGGASSGRNTSLGTLTGYGELVANASPATWPAYASESLVPFSSKGSIYPTSLLNQVVLSGNWTPTLKCSVTGTSASSITADLILRVWTWNSGTLTTTKYGVLTLAAQTISTTPTIYVFSAASLPTIAFGSNDYLYIDVVGNVTSNPNGAGVSTKFRCNFSASASQGTNTAQAVAPALAPARIVSSTVALQSTLTRTVAGTASLVLQRTVSATAALQSTLTRTVSTTTALQSTLTRTVSTTGALQSTLTRTVSTTGALQSTLTRTIPLTGVLLSTLNRTVAATGALQSTLTRTVPATSPLQSTRTRTVSTSAAFQLTSIRTVPTTTALQSTLTRTVGTTGALDETFTRTVPVTVALQGTFTRIVPVTGALLSTLTRSVSTLGVFQGTFTRTVPVTGAFYTTATRSIPTTCTFTITLTRSVPVTGALQSTLTRTVPMTGVLTVTLTRTIPTVGVLQVTQIRSVPTSMSLSLPPLFTIGNASSGPLITGAQLPLLTGTQYQFNGQVLDTPSSCTTPLSTGQVLIQGSQFTLVFPSPSIATQNALLSASRGMMQFRVSAGVLISGQVSLSIVQGMCWIVTCTTLVPIPVPA